ncbi:hypothetical protein HMN09_00819900 [Mycena chlorophos]|uniref:Uncharacterized protein n=1 Tax=Mycena chlorophos TaxID=658473 RepID=A0A8H6SVM6_MYCCL|nr:hypothetical protein HMN09_00819900 [Mycena chlorophos]
MAPANPEPVHDSEPPQPPALEDRVQRLRKQLRDARANIADLELQLATEKAKAARLAERLAGEGVVAEANATVNPTAEQPVGPGGTVMADEKSSSHSDDGLSMMSRADLIEENAALKKELLELPGDLLRLFKESMSRKLANLAAKIQDEDPTQSKEGEEHKEKTKVQDSERFALEEERKAQLEEKERQLRAAQTEASAKHEEAQQRYAERRKALEAMVAKCEVNAARRAARAGNINILIEESKALRKSLKRVRYEDSEQVDDSDSEDAESTRSTQRIKRETD